MGWEKEQRIIQEESARNRARNDGQVCGGCSEPLLTEDEVFEGICGGCQHTMNKDD